MRIKENTKQVYKYIYEYYETYGYPPTQREIATACFLARSAVHYHMQKLCHFGFISWDEGKTRAFKPLKTIDQMLKVAPNT